MSAKKYTSLSIKQKLEIIKESTNKNKTELCAKYKCSLSTINRVFRDVKILENKSRICAPSRKRERIGSCKEVEAALLTWYGQMKSSGAAISRSIVMKQAKQFALMLNLDFTPSAGWYSRWKNRHGIDLKRKQGEQPCADFEGPEDFRTMILPHLTSSFAARDIFNAGESSLFYGALSSSTLSEDEEEANDLGLESSEDRLKLFFICNATGDYKKCIVIGKSTSPVYFETNKFPLQYFSNEKACMNEYIWAKIVCSLDEEMITLNRKIILFVDNADCHKKLDNLKNINVQFLPSNSTSNIQPLNQGIIRCFKDYYHQNLMRKQIAAMECGQTIEEFSKSITTLQAMHISKDCLGLIKPSTIRNCFRKAGYIREEEKERQPEGDVVKIENDSDFAFLACDDNLSCYGELTDSEILETPAENPLVTNEEEVEEKFKPIIPSSAEMLQCIQILRSYFLPLNKFRSELENMEEEVLKTKITQTKITDFFSPRVKRF